MKSQDATTKQRVTQTEKNVQSASGGWEFIGARLRRVRQGLKHLLEGLLEDFTSIEYESAFLKRVQGATRRVAPCSCSPAKGTS